MVLYQLFNTMVFFTGQSINDFLLAILVRHGPYGWALVKMVSMSKGPMGPQICGDYMDRSLESWFL